MTDAVDELDELDLSEFLSPEELKKLEEEKKLAAQETVQPPPSPPPASCPRLSPICPPFHSVGTATRAT